MLEINNNNNKRVVVKTETDGPDSVQANSLAMRASVHHNANLVYNITLLYVQPMELIIAGKEYLQITIKLSPVADHASGSRCILLWPPAVAGRSGL